MGAVSGNVDEYHNNNGSDVKEKKKRKGDQKERGKQKQEASYLDLLPHHILQHTRCYILKNMGFPTHLKIPTPKEVEDIYYLRNSHHHNKFSVLCCICFKFKFTSQSEFLDPFQDPLCWKYRQLLDEMTHKYNKRLYVCNDCIFLHWRDYFSCEERINKLFNIKFKWF
jgi:hypothetical protein